MKKLKEGSEKEALYKIEFKKSAVKELEKLNPRDIPRIVDAIESLSTNPLPHYSKKNTGKEKSLSPKGRSVQNNLPSRFQR